jgi:hypothetical protein
MGVSMKIKSALNKHRTSIQAILILAGVSIAFFFSQWLLAFLLTGRHINSFLPGYSDMIEYHMSIKTAVENGMFSQNAGYFGQFYADGKGYADWLYYGAHGFLSVTPYILTGIVIGGWTNYAPLIAHLIIITLALFVVYFCCRSFKKTLGIQLLLFSFSPFLMYYHSMMIEIEMYAVALICVAAYYFYETCRSRSALCLFALSVLLAASFRITNIVFIIPLLVNFIREKDLLKFVAIIGISITSIIIFIVNGKTSAPYYYNFLTTLKNAFYDDITGNTLSTFKEHFITSAKLFFAMNEQNSPRELTLHFLLRYSMIGISIMVLVEKVRTGQDRTGQDRTGQDRTGQDRTGQDRTGTIVRQSHLFLFSPQLPFLI